MPRSKPNPASIKTDLHQYSSPDSRKTLADQKKQHWHHFTLIVLVWLNWAKWKHCNQEMYMVKPKKERNEKHEKIKCWVSHRPYSKYTNVFFSTHCTLFVSHSLYEVDAFMLLHAYYVCNMEYSVLYRSEWRFILLCSL